MIYIKFVKLRSMHDKIQYFILKELLLTNIQNYKTKFKVLLLLMWNNVIKLLYLHDD